MLFNAAIEMYRLGMRVLMVDLDAQANLTAISWLTTRCRRCTSRPPGGLRCRQRRDHRLLAQSVMAAESAGVTGSPGPAAAAEL
jgi:hypothetical protein